MRVLVIYQYFGTPRGSWSTRIYEFAWRWVAAGHSVTVITAPYEKSDIQAKRFIESQEVDGISLKVIRAADSNRLSVPGRAWRAILFSCCSLYFATILPYDVILCSSGPITVGLPGILARLVRRKKFVFEVRDLWPAGGIEMGKIRQAWLKNLALMFERMCYRFAQVVVTASPDQERHILLRYPALRTLVIPNASDCDLFAPPAELARPGWAKGKHLFAHIGSIGFIHAVGFWIDVAAELQASGDNSICLVLIGEGSERAHWETVVKEKGLQNVQFLGLLPKQELPAWVQASVATLFATLNNPVQNSSSPNKVFDSFAAGTPVIQTTTGWIADLITREKCGINVAPGDVVGAAAVMQSLAANPGERQRLSAAATLVASTQFDRSALADRYLSMLVSLHG